MVWYFIGVYIINRTLHGCLEIQNFSSRVDKIFHLFAALTCEIFFQHSKRNFVSPRGHVISSIFSTAELYLCSFLAYHTQASEVTNFNPYEVMNI